MSPQLGQTFSSDGIFVLQTLHGLLDLVSDADVCLSVSVRFLFDSDSWLFFLCSKFNLEFLFFFMIGKSTITVPAPMGRTMYTKMPHSGMYGMAMARPNIEIPIDMTIIPIDTKIFQFLSNFVIYYFHNDCK